MTDKKQKSIFARIFAVLLVGLILVLLVISGVLSVVMMSGIVSAQVGDADGDAVGDADGDAGVPQYNFGTMQPTDKLAGKPGQTIETRLYFYNVYGNRPTHVRLEITETPDNWDVSIVPGVGDVEYEVAGVIQTVNENLVVYPSEAQEQAGRNSDEKEWISSKVGYIESDFVDVVIEIPENEEIGITENIKINGVAFWLGQGGNIALEQEREFEYAVTTTTEYYEKPVNRITGFAVGDFVSDNPVVSIVLGIVLVLVIVLVVMVIVLGKKVSNAGKSKKPAKKRGKNAKNKKQ